MRNILVTGAQGQLGSEINAIASNYPEFKFWFTGRTELDITNQQAVKDFVDTHQINGIINCAAYTAVDKAESEPALAKAINHVAVRHMAEIAKAREITLVHISTDYVFDGTNHKPYIETDVPNPQSVYGQSKLDGELAIQAVNPANAIIIRTSWVYSKFGNNFVKTMLRLAETKAEISVVADQIGTPTNAADLAQAILSIFPKIKNESVQTFHYANEGVCSWYDFAKAIYEIKGMRLKVNPIETKQYPTPAKRPFYSVLNKKQFKTQYALEIAHWQHALKESKF